MSTPTARRPARRRRVSTRSLGFADAYRRRIADAVRAGYPKLVVAIGDEVFDAVVTEYISAHPSIRLGRGAGARLPEHLGESRVHPPWYGELALLDRAYADVAALPEAERTTRDELRDPALPLVLVPAHALVELTTTADELWLAIDAHEPVVRPSVLPWPRTVIIWRTHRATIAQRQVDADEAAALRLASDGAKLDALCATLGAQRTSSPVLATGSSAALRVNPTARAVDMILRWIDDGLLARGR